MPIDDIAGTRIAVVGVGHWHATVDARYLDQLRDLDTHLVGVSDADFALAKSRGDAYGAPAFADYREMLAKVDPEFVVALGRHSEMAAIADFLIGADYPFMMEKPMALSSDQLRPVVARAEKKGAFVAVPYTNRESAFARRASEMIEQGDFGKVSHVQLRMIRPSPSRYVQFGSPWMLDPSESGGGCLRNLGGHGLDLFRLLVGPNVEVVAASMSSAAHELPIEDYAIVTLKAGEVIGTVEVGYTFPTDGTDGEWRIAGSDAHLIWKGDSLIETRNEGDPVVTKLDFWDTYRKTVTSILRAWKRDEPPVATARDCLLADELIDDAYRAALGGLPGDRK